MKNYQPLECTQPIMDQLTKNGGVFITAGTMEDANTMTISWGMVGLIWQRPLFLTAIRMDRFTHHLVEKYGAFTIGVPKENTLSEQLLFMGSKSGRDIDKYEQSGLSLLPGQYGPVPVIEQCALQLECRVVSSHIMEPLLTDANIRAQMYDKLNVYHNLYYGEILGCYSTEE